MTGELREDFRVAGRLVCPRLNRVEDGQGRAAQVQPKIMCVLLLLAERPGEVVTRERLLATVWAGTHVTEHVLSRAISELRRLFDDSAQEPRVIETIPKVGYRLVASVADARDENTEDETAAPAPAPTAEATADAPPPSAAPPQPPAVAAAAPRTPLEALRTWAGLAALSSVTLLLLVVAYLLLTARHVGPWHAGH